MSNKIGRNKDWCKGYSARNQEGANFKRKHATLANRLEKKLSKLNVRGLSTDGIARAIQHHNSLAKR